MQWYEEEVKSLESEIAGLAYEPSLVFYGSSSIRLWETLEEDFKGYIPFNAGFGGSTLAACVWYFDRIFAKLNPDLIILYAGDNDLGDGRSPQDVLYSFNELMHSVQRRFGNIPLAFISIKPSISRIEIIGKIAETNSLIQDAINKADDQLFYIDVFSSMLDPEGRPKPALLDADGLHLSADGYQVWKQAILTQIANKNLKLAKAS
jgi:hypothetical protein